MMSHYLSMPIEYSASEKGLRSLLEKNRRHADNPLQKLRRMQEIYLERNESLYTPEDLRLVRYYLDAVAYKFHLANLSLEQMWSLSHVKRGFVITALENSLDRLQTSQDELLIISFVFEGFLFQARAFLDFYMLYLCYFFKTGHKGNISRGKFSTALKRVQGEPFSHKALRVHTYFQQSVFSETTPKQFVPENWGILLTSLRDKIAHRDRVRPAFQGQERLLGKVLFDWPTLQQTTYDRFCQDMNNGMFSLFTDVSPILYDLDWKPGPCRDDLWS